MRKMWKVLAWSAAVPVTVVVLITVAWAVAGGADSGRSAPNLRLGDRDVSRLTATQAVDVVAMVAADLESTPIRVTTPNGDFEIEPGAVGLAVDRDATVEAVLSAGGHDRLPLGPFRWARSMVGGQRAQAVVSVDTTALAAEVARLDPARQPAVEPGVTVGDDGRLVITDAAPGRGLDPAAVEDLVLDAAADGKVPITVEAEPSTLAPRFTPDQAAAVAAEAERLTSRGLDVAADGHGAHLEPGRLLTWVRLDSSGSQLAFGIDPDRSTAELAELLPDAGEPAKDAAFQVTGGEVVITPEEPGTACCAPESAALIRDALVAGASSVELPLRAAEPDRTVAEARELGIVEEVGSFTTRHACCESRVQNIHRIADIVRGTVIEPGGELSINELVGRRTRDKGFVDAGVIYNGRFESDVGGGISQFITTFFNAAFFAGLEFEEYQSHSIYISRYPYGREATISYPAPDFRISNPTDHGVLVWTSYDSTSITVSLWSTKTVEAEQTGQSRRPQGNCTRVTTERTRTWLADGRREVDHVFAVYRPGEGVNC